MTLRSPSLPRFVPVALGAALAMTAACGGGQRSTSTVEQDDAYDFSDVETFSLVQLAPPEGLTQGDLEFVERYDAALGGAIRSELIARGLTEVPAGQPADLVFTFAYGGERKVARAQLGSEVGMIHSVEGQIIVRAATYEDVDAAVWRHQVDFFLQSEWPEIDQAEANAPNVARRLMAPFPIPRRDAAAEGD